LALGISNCRAAEDAMRAVVEAERQGVKTAFISEDIGCRDAFQLAAAAAERTQDIRLAIGVANPYTRSPVALAMSAATLDELSQGRAILGLGSSSPEIIQDQLGIPYGRRITVMREAVQIIRTLLNGDEISVDGEHFHLSAYHLELGRTPRSIPIYLAAMGPLMLQLAGRIADGVILNTGSTPAHIAWATEQIQHGAASADRQRNQVTIAVWVAAYIGSDVAVLFERARRWAAAALSIRGQGELLLEKAGLPLNFLPRIRAHYQAYPHRGDLERAALEVPDEVVSTLAVVGQPDEAQARLGTYLAAGANILILGPTPLRRLVGRNQRERQ
jgi:5,10-methylenetetrahydromethanopterin reductase